MLTLDNAVVYDVETLVNCFTLTAEMLHSDVRSTWEISDHRDDRAQLLEWFEYLRRTQTPMIGFNSVGFDYPICHLLFTRPQSTVADIYAKAQAIIGGGDANRFAHTVWDRDRFAPQIDLFKIHHFDNKAKTTTLKALQINMRAERVVDMPVAHDQPVGHNEIAGLVIPYNCHDVSETKRFAHISMPAINFRIGLVDQFGIDVLNFNDTKIGEKMLEKRLGDDVCYERRIVIDQNGNERTRREKRQSPRYRIALSEIIFPYVRFNNPEFQRVLEFMRGQVLTPEDLEDPEAPIKTKGVFSDLHAHVGGLDFHFGTGGVHASVEKRRFEASGDWLIRDIDVAALYPSIAIVNRLAPEHLGEAFIAEYAKIPEERNLHKKGTYQNAALKLAANGAWGKSNSKFSVFYDPKYAMTIPINGQLLICMLAEWLLTVPTLSIIQANTDGITYMIHRSDLTTAHEIEDRWQAYTCLKLEDAAYSRMWIRDVNNYIAEDTKGKLKQKGAYWHPDPLNYADSISQASPPCWYKDLGNIVSIKAANAAMIHGVDPDAFIRAHSDPFDFMCRVKVDRQSQLMLGGQPIQRTTRYYVARQGAPMVKVSPPAKGATVGEYKRRNGISEAEFVSISATIPPGTWDERIHTKNKSRYQMREMAIEAGWNVAECNDARAFRFDNVNYDWYVQEARKLIIV